MDEKHRILLQKHRIAIAKDLDPLRMFGYLAKLDRFTADDEEDIKSISSRSGRVERLLDILPRKGEGAFECFVRALEKESPNLAKPLLLESGLSPCTQPEEEKLPIQDKDPQVSGGTLVQDLLKGKKLDNFINCLDLADDFGNDWKMLYKVFDLPPDSISKFEEKPGSPTRNMLTAWCRRRGDSANVETLLQAMPQCKRGDCLQILENDLGCKLSDLELSKRMSTLGIEQADGAVNRFEFLKDLSEDDLHTISSNIPVDKTESLKQKLQDKFHLESVSELTMKNVLQKCGEVKIRVFMEMLKDFKCQSVIKEVREFLPAGITGPLLKESMNVRDVSYNVRNDVTIALSGNNDYWRRLGAALNIPNEHLEFINARKDNPGDEVLKRWEVTAESRVGNLYNILVRIGYPMIADKL